MSIKYQDLPLKSIWNIKRNLFIKIDTKKKKQSEIRGLTISS